MLQSARLPLQQILWKDVKCVTQALHDDELMQHMLLLQSGSHLLRQSEWNVSILIAMQKQGWWIIRGNVADGTESVERPRLCVRVMSGDFLRPQPLLPAEQVKKPPVVSFLEPGGSQWR